MPRNCRDAFINFFVISLFQTPGVGKAANVLVGKALGTNGTSPSNQTLGSVCHPAQTTEAVVLFTIAALGMGANMFLMLLIVFKRPLRRYNPKYIIELAKNKQRACNDTVVSEGKNV